MPTYDPLAILDRASAHSAEWLQQLDAAAARQTEARQRAFAFGLANDLAFGTHRTSLDRTNAANVYGTRRAQADTRLLPFYETRQGAQWRLDADQAQMQRRLLPAQEAMQGSAYRLGDAQNTLALDAAARAWTPDNRRARAAIEDMRYQNPVAEAAAQDAAGRQADPLRSAQAAQGAAAAWPGAQGVAGRYAAPYAGGLYANASSALLAGNLDTANALLGEARLGSVAAESDGHIVFTDAQGNAYPAMTPAAAAALLQTLTAQAPTALQQYTDAATRGTGTLTPAQESQRTVLEHRIRTLDKAMVNALDETERASLQLQRDEATQALSALFGGGAMRPAAGSFGALGFGAETAPAASAPGAAPAAATAPASAATPAGAPPPSPPPAAPTRPAQAAKPQGEDYWRDFAYDRDTGTMRRRGGEADPLQTYRDAAERWRAAEARLREAREAQERHARTGSGVDRTAAIARYAQVEEQARTALLAAREAYTAAQQRTTQSDAQGRAPASSAPAVDPYRGWRPAYLDPAAAGGTSVVPYRP